MTRAFDLVIFDCDGVLVDSEVISARVIIRALAELGVVIDLGYVFEHFVGHSFPSVAQTIRTTFDVDLPEDFELHYRRKLMESFEVALRTTPGVVAVLDDLDVPSCVATSSSPERTARALEFVGLTRSFSHVFTASEVKRGKPEPDLFLHAARCMGSDPVKCLVIEDSLPGIAAGRAAGMSVLRYTGGEHLRALPASRLSAGGDVGVFDKWADLRKMEPTLFRTRG